MTPPRLPTATVKVYAEVKSGGSIRRALAIEVLALRAAGDAMAAAIDRRFPDIIDARTAARAWRTARGEDDGTNRSEV